MHWSGHRKDLNPHLVLNQSLEAKREEGTTAKPVPALLPSTARSVPKTHPVPSFPALPDLAPLPRAGGAFWHHFLTITMGKACRSCCGLPQPSQSHRGTIPNENSISLLRVTETNVAATANHRPRSWSSPGMLSEQPCSELRHKYMCVMSVCSLCLP